LVPPVEKYRANYTAGPRMALIPILVPKCGKDFVVVCRIRNVSDEKEYLLKHFLSPFRIEIRDHSGPINVITIVEMQVVVVSCIESKNDKSVSK
jgi:hypothetical protein